jgi:hypothetical protein
MGSRRAVPRSRQCVLSARPLASIVALVPIIVRPLATATLMRRGGSRLGRVAVSPRPLWLALRRRCGPSALGLLLVVLARHVAARLVTVVSAMQIGLLFRARVAVA